MIFFHIFSNLFEWYICTDFSKKNLGVDSSPEYPHPSRFHMAAFISRFTGFNGVYRLPASVSRAFGTEKSNFPIKVNTENIIYYFNINKG